MSLCRIVLFAILLSRSSATCQAPSIQQALRVALRVTALCCMVHSAIRVSRFSAGSHPSLQQALRAALRVIMLCCTVLFAIPVSRPSACCLLLPFEQALIVALRMMLICCMVFSAISTSVSRRVAL